MIAGDWLARRAALTPERVALIDTLGGNRRISYRDWNAAANRTARLLRELGVARGDRVAVLAMNCVAYLDIWFACGKLGAIMQPLNWRLTPAEIGGLIEDGLEPVGQIEALHQVQNHAPGRFVLGLNELNVAGLRLRLLLLFLLGIEDAALHLVDVGAPKGLRHDDPRGQRRDPDSSDQHDKEHSGSSDFQYFVEDVGAQANVTCNSCTFILTNSDSSPTATIGSVTMNGGAEMHLTASTSGTYKDILIYQDRRASSSSSTINKINGNANTLMSGAFYFPNQQIQLNGTSGLDFTCAKFVGRTVDFSGNGSINNSCPGGYGSGSIMGKHVRLVA